ncbi:MAG: stage II sporulation protein M [Firmicutes bacterium]|nr:stage II sporulation protein M [Bacillota bacterium]
MREGINAFIREYLRENLGIYMIVGFIFAAGVLGGVLLLRYMQPGAVGEVADHFTIFVRGLEKGGGIDHGSVFRASIGQNFRHLALICLAGVFANGFPLISLLVAMRGMAIGFTVAFLIEKASVGGVLFSLAAVAPHNMIVIPVILIVAATGFDFSWRRFRAIYIEKRPRSFGENLFSYGRTIFYLSLALIIGSLVETYVSMLFVRLAATAFPG